LEGEASESLALKVALEDLRAAAESGKEK
jgi:hypothetical protein